MPGTAYSPAGDNDMQVTQVSVSVLKGQREGRGCQVAQSRPGDNAMQVRINLAGSMLEF